MLQVDLLLVYSSGSVRKWLMCWA